MARTTKEERKKKPYYVDNKKFFEAMVEFKETVKKAEENGDKRPIVPDYVADCIMKIATHLSYKPNFINYTFRDEMICDGIENSLQYIDNFNPDKSKNPFAYFTQIIHYAFLRRIQKEKKYMKTKNKFLQTMDLDSFFDQDPDNVQGTSDFLENLKRQLEIMEKEEADQAANDKTPKRRPKYFDKKEVDSKTETE